MSGLRSLLPACLTSNATVSARVEHKVTVPASLLRLNFVRATPVSLPCLTQHCVHDFFSRPSHSRQTDSLPGKSPPSSYTRRYVSNSRILNNREERRAERGESIASPTEMASRKGRGGGGGGAGRGSQGGKPKKTHLTKDKEVSKALSWLLRHGLPERTGVDIDEGGWAHLSDVVSCTTKSSVF